MPCPETVNCSAPSLPNIFWPFFERHHNKDQPMTKASKLSAAELLFAPRLANRSKPERASDHAAIAPKAFLARSERPAGTMHLPRKP